MNSETEWNPAKSEPDAQSKFPWVLVVVALLLLALALSASYFSKPYTVRAQNSCIASLKQIEGAKATWARAHNKKETDTPEFKDLFGEHALIRVVPICPKGGIYTLGPMNQKPRCSFCDHRTEDDTPIL